MFFFRIPPCFLNLYIKKEATRFQPNRLKNRWLLVILVGVYREKVRKRKKAETFPVGKILGK